MLNIFDDLILWTDENDLIIDANALFLNCIEKTKEEIIGKKEENLFDIHITSDIELSDNNTPIYEENIIFANNIQKYYKTKKECVFQENIKKFKITRKDISEYKKCTAIYNDHKILLKHIASGTDIKVILEEIIKSVESRNPSMFCSILLLDESKTKLITGAAPSLPDFYNEKINGMTIGEKVGSCGAAVFLKEKVIVEDIATHENWKYAKNLAKKINVHACWSQPIFSSNNEVLGSFAIYYNKTRKPTDFENLLIEDIASITGIAIEKHLNQLKAQKEQEIVEQQEQLLMHRSKQAMMGEMLENIAHQWRQPLSIISTYATGILMKKKYGLSNEEEEYKALEAININAQYLSNTIEDFRNYFTSTTTKTQFSIIECLEHTSKLIESRLEIEKIKLITNIQDVQINSYKNELTQVFMNIFNNSADALEKIETKDRYIQVNVYEEEGFMVLKSIDSGNGAQDHIIKRIFEPYFTTKHQNYGTGIGLYMCQEIIEKHMRGTISARNSKFTFKNKTYLGLEFTIKIPLN
ncbi:MAG: ATP-binding protein [Candidatus Marinarcus sp.]|uniref:GAF domain-containing sensor histidine kinase n=1 Tax=Candidatus Marinarcus sp. TaxID=3100987 RepID=UPI003AFFF04A